MSGMKRFPDSSAGPRGGSRAALFDGIEEGGIRASSSSYSDEIAEQDNERAVDGLQDRVNVLKRLTTDIHEEVHQHNRLLDMMGDGMDATRGMLAGTADRFSKPIPRYGLNFNVRVCDTCYESMNKPTLPTSSSAMDNTPVPVRDGSERASSSARQGSSTGADYHREEAQACQPVVDCTCHMPLCICEPPDGLREAVKAGDVAAVRELLGKGLTADYQDKQGMTLAHLAAMFNHTEVVMLLMENGACMTKVNSQGETPIDCAPATLGLRMRQKMASISAQ
eukprot:SM000060S19630  [mRNA]  locus=s60:280298:285356:+ [translate_table: standard]